MVANWVKREGQAFVPLPTSDDANDDGNNNDAVGLDVMLPQKDSSRSDNAAAADTANAKGVKLEEPTAKCVV